jgi:hypothetical protein
MSDRLKMCTACVIALLAVVAGGGSDSRAASISNLFNTGVNASSTVIPAAGVADPHYALIVSPNSATAVTVDDTNYPFPPWIANSATSRWIGPAIDSFGTGGSTFIYRTTFTLPANAQLSSVSVTGKWAVDDAGTDILINGASTGQTNTSWTTLTPFSVTSGFVAGTNNLDFVVTNAGFAPFTNSTGLRVDAMAGNYLIVPEPVGVRLALVGLVAMVVLPQRLPMGKQPGAAMP